MILLLQISTFVSFPLSHRGEVSLAKYIGESKRYNMDIGIGLEVSLISFRNSFVSIEYRDELEMAEQVGNIVFDPFYSHYYGILRFETIFKDLRLFTDYVHDCKHNIDRLPDSNKVVFNRFRGGFLYHRKPATFFIRYGYYPHAVFIDWLNSTDLYHDLLVQLRVNIYALRSLGFEFINENYITFLSNDVAGFYIKRNIKLSLEAKYKGRTGTLGINISYYPWANDLIKSPQGLFILGIFYRI